MKVIYYDNAVFASINFSDRMNFSLPWQENKAKKSAGIIVITPWWTNLHCKWWDTWTMKRIQNCKIKTNLRIQNGFSQILLVTKFYPLLYIPLKVINHIYIYIYIYKILNWCIQQYFLHKYLSDIVPLKL